MKRTFEYRIARDMAPVSIKSLLKQKGFSTKSLIALKAIPGSILVNDTPVFLTYLLNPEDHLVLHLEEDASSEHILPVRLPLSILYEDDDLMVVNKPAGMPIHPSRNHYDNSLGNALAWYFAERNVPFVYRCINRLDRDTSGLTIIAKNKVSAGILSHMVAQKSLAGPAAENGIYREYLAIVRNRPFPAEGVIDAPLSRRPGSIIERYVDPEKGERAVTHYKTLYTRNGYSLVSLVLETGRTHQIRVHMQHLGYPLIGDYLYNPDYERMDRQALHACRLRFCHPLTGEQIDICCPLPEDMRWITDSAF